MTNIRAFLHVLGYELRFWIMFLTGLGVAYMVYATLVTVFGNSLTDLSYIVTPLNPLDLNFGLGTQQSTDYFSNQFNFTLKGVQQ